MGIGNQLRSRGFSLIELSIATAIFSMGVSSFSLLLLLALQGTAESRYQSLAVTQAESLAERVLMNSDAVGHYIFPADSSTAACNDTTCSPQQVAYSDISEWRAMLAQGLPGGTGVVCRDTSPDDGDVSNASCDGNGSPVIKVFWDEPVKNDGTENSKRLVSRLPLP